MKTRTDDRRGPPPLRRPVPDHVDAALPATPSDGDNVGLWLDRLLPRDARSWDLTGNQRVEALRPYARAWTATAAAEALARRVDGVRVIGLEGEVPAGHAALLLRVEAALSGPLLVDYGRASATEMSLSFHPLFGAPRIPGSALKGASRAYAALAGEEDDITRDVWGLQEQGGSVQFFDALPALGRFSLALDVLTPHMGRWYQGKDDKPVEYRSPVPHSFLTVARARFVFDLMLATEVDDDEGAGLLRAAGRALAGVISDLGVGAKTAAGYGYFEME